MRSRSLLAGTLVVLAAGAAWVTLGRDPVVWSWSAVVASGAGHVGPWRMNRSDWRYVDDPAVALDEDGRAAVVWVDQERKDVLFRRFSPDGEPDGGTVNVSRTPGVFSWLPRVAIPPDDPDHVYVLWQEIVFSGGTHGGEAFFARSVDGGRTFDEPVNLSQTSAGVGKGRTGPRRWHNGSLDLAVAPDGVVHAVWTAWEGGLWAARSADGGESFSSPLRVTERREDEPARAPAVAAGPDGSVHLLWAVGEDPAADLRYARSDDGGGTFADPRRLFGSEGRADAPAAAVAPDGRLHVAWAESPAGRRGGHRIRHVRADAEGGLGEPRTVAGPDAGGGDAELESVRYPSLAVDGGGDPWVLWERYPRGADRSRGLGLTVSPDGGESFGAPVLVPDTDDPSFSLNGSLQGLLMRKLAVGADGEVAVVNSSFEPGEASRVRLIRGRAAGKIFRHVAAARSDPP